MSVAAEQHLGVVDTWDLQHFNWPIQRLFAPHAVQHLELARAMNDLLATGRWDVVRAQPHHEPGGHLSDHLFDLYGRPASTAPAV
jgi:hypothetical protein